MRLWPRTLLWRSVLLIALVLVVANLAWWQIFRVSEREPRARQAAQQLVSIVNLTRAALVTAQPAKRYDLLAELSQQEGIQVYAGEPDERIAPLPDRPFLQVIASHLREKLGPDTRMALARDGVRGLWVSFRIDGDEYWVLLPGSRIERNEPLIWVGLGALVLVLALTGAFLIVARINQPLRELTRAAAQMGQGTIPAPVTETGPAEICTVARAFNQMASDLKRLDEERALLLAGVSHDLRTPLSRIRLGLEMLDDKGATEIKSDLVQDIEDIDAAISQFLDFARLADAEAMVANGDLNALVRSVVARYERSGRNVTMQLSPLPPLAQRPVAIQRLVANLIDNALRHSGTAVEVRTAADAGVATIEVLDRGPGIPRDQAERMLQPFTRLESARTGPGTGLGLAIVARIASMHGGEVRLLPREGGGLRARVELPLGAGAQAAR
ncbi:MAG: HAMP domain-containing protein [Betaproteobacteria bacterium]|nr:HAMP domain-containing protein [Betaproteobacteria bacterium]